MSEAGETRLTLDWGELAALTWRRPGRPRVLCLHGWMDNAASFVPLAGELDDLDIVALDYAGHGHSDHRPAAARYYFTDYLYDLDAALDALGWSSCTLLGHSLGAALGTGYAAAAPERVDALMMLDGLGMVTEPTDQAAGRLHRSLRAVRNPRKHRRKFPDVAAAAAIRQANNPMTDNAAKLLAERALLDAGDGLRWRTDARAMWPSPNYMTEAQSDALLGAIECPVLAVYTAVLEAYLGDRLDRRLPRLRDVTAVRLDGGHHLHMDDPDPVASAVIDFCDRVPTRAS